MPGGGFGLLRRSLYDSKRAAENPLESPGQKPQNKPEPPSPSTPVNVMVSFCTSMRAVAEGVFVARSSSETGSSAIGPQSTAADESMALAIHTLVSYLRISFHPVASEATAALCALVATGTPLCSLAIEAGAIAPLADSMDASCGHRVIAANALAHMAYDNDAREKMVSDRQLVTHAFELLVEGTASIQLLEGFHRPVDDSVSDAAYWATLILRAVMEVDDGIIFEIVHDAKLLGALFGLLTCRVSRCVEAASAAVTKLMHRVAAASPAERDAHIAKLEESVMSLPPETHPPTHLPDIMDALQGGTLELINKCSSDGSNVRALEQAIDLGRWFSLSSTVIGEARSDFRETIALKKRSLFLNEQMNVVTYNYAELKAAISKCYQATIKAAQECVPGDFDTQKPGASTSQPTQDSAYPVSGPTQQVQRRSSERRESFVVSGLRSSTQWFNGLLGLAAPEDLLDQDQRVVRGRAS